MSAIDLQSQQLAPLLVRLGNTATCIESGCIVDLGLQAGGRWVYSGGHDTFLAADYPVLYIESLANLVRTDQLTGTAEAVRSPEIGDVEAVVADDQRVYVVSGAETSVSRYQVVAIAHSDITKARWTVPLSDSDRLTALFLKDGVLWVTGAFREIAGQPQPGLAALDPVTGALLPETVRFDFAWLPGGTVTYSIKAAEGDHFMVAGNFTSVNGLPRPGFALLDFHTGEVLSWNPVKGDGSRIESVAVTTNAVYVLGNFTEIGGVARHNFAVFDRLSVPQLRSPQLTAAGFTAQVSAAPGYAHMLQRSPDLRSWQTLSTNTPASGEFTVQDKAPATGPQFYRLLVR